NHIAAAFDLNPIADFDAQALDFVHVVESGPTHSGAADGNRFQHGDGCQFASSANLHDDVLNLGDAGASSIFVGNRPSRSLPGVTEFLLQPGTIDLNDDSVNLVGQLLPLGFLPLDEGPDFIKVFHQLSAGIDLESGGIEGI